MHKKLQKKTLNTCKTQTHIPHHPGETGIQFYIGGCNRRESTKP